ncbi:thermostable hemolysin [Photobacterium sp. 1_MG-2023]|uniref:thermostable hemolysin n=1 Tax=Photobacterium sp. 1_MG-2023 TaxID=3062646 RepID=UPI0026E16C1D|nr:thermostable hemolysin [Photobacterium sp. 1_MG-2023]MDO6705064.1 thermostable hemolysin [Photobacterium sp. 1_MG-2023]
MGSNDDSNLLTMMHIDRDHPFRKNTEQYIADRYTTAFQAQLNRFMPDFLALVDAHKQLLSVCGYQSAAVSPLFLEQYLDCPAEQLIAQALGHPVARSELIEFGQLASFSHHLSRLHFTKIAEHLVGQGYTWCIFTATGPLQAMMHRLGLTPVLLADATASRIHNAEQIWGTYYQRHPKIYAGHLATGLNILKQRQSGYRHVSGGQR